jgi:uncharacterized protein (DUF2062 family)
MPVNARSGVPAFFRNQWTRRVAGPIRTQLAAGIPVRRVAWSATLGLIAAAWPQIGTNVVMAWILARLFRCSTVLAGGVSFLASPLQYLLMIPHLRLGEKMLGVEPFQTTVPDILRIVLTDPVGSFRILGVPLVHAIVGWITVSALLALPLHRVFAVLIRKGWKGKTTEW